MVTFNPLTATDYDTRATLVQGALSSGGMASTDDLMGRDIFGASGYDEDDDRSMALYHRRGYIDLTGTPASPLLNLAVAGRTGENLKLVLGMGTEIEDILRFRVVAQGGDLIPVSDLPDSINPREYEFGPQILESMIEEFDIHRELMKAIKSFLFEFVKYLDWEVVEESTAYPIIGCYYGKPSDDNAMLGGAYMNWLVSKGSQLSKFRRLSYLYALDNLPDGKDRLRCCIVKRVMVTPVNTRPSMDENRFDPLTKAYKELYLARAHVVQTFIGTPSKATAIKAYSSLLQKAEFLFIEHDKYHAQDKSVLERLKGKHGLIRDKMLGKRVDFSGRSVITINPFMSIRDIGIPRDMLPKLYRSAIMRSKRGSNDPSSYIPQNGNDKADECMSVINSEGLLSEVKVVTGRQPTLHKPSMRAFNPVPVDSRSIQLNPLCVIGFNADFDGDQMYVRVPTTEEGIAEANELLNIEQNMYLPKSGECVVMPRQEIIYGLNVCTRNVQPQGNTTQFAKFDELLNAIKYQRIHIYDRVSWHGLSGTAGQVAFLACVDKQNTVNGYNYHSEARGVEITSKTIKPIVNKLVQAHGKNAIGYIDNMVKLGFIVAGTYPPALNLLDNVGLNYSAQINAFHDAIADDKEAYEMGWETESEYQEAYSAQYSSKVSTAVNVESDIDPENGFVRLAKSGARGSMSLVQQLYGYKGLVQDGSTGGYFRAVIEHSYANQLTPLEHFVTAYGGRAGLITKSLSTADSGYAARKIWHATSPFMITVNDCGTTDGITVSLADIVESIGVSPDSAREIFVDIITGRYLAQPHYYRDKAGNKVEDEAAGAFITRDMATKWSMQDNAGAVIRSILKCKNPCCKKCYGTDLSSNRLAASGLPIGFIAAQSIGEPGTQLNMDAFKKGGVAEGKASRLTGFTKLAWYISCKKEFNTLDSYDPIAWADGEVTVVPKTNGTKVIRIAGSRHAVSVPVSVPIKTEPAVRGKPLRVTVGDRSVNEIAAYAGLEQAQRYLCYALYDVYRDTDKVNFKHFEVLAAAMTMYRVYTTDRSDLVPGQLHDILMLYGHNASLANTVYSAEVVNVTNVQCSRPYALSRVIMENVRSGLSDIVLLGLSDPLTYPLNRIMMGMKPYEDMSPDSPYFKELNNGKLLPNKFMNDRRV